MKKIPEFPEITEGMKQKYNYWAIDPNKVLWVYKDLPTLTYCSWISSGRYEFEDSYEVIKLEGELKDWTKAVGYLCLDKPNNWDSLWVTEEPKYTTLTNREVMTALLEGKEIQQRWVLGNSPEELGEWESVDYLCVKISGGLNNPVGTGGWEEGKLLYRIKPETKTVRVFNGVELPDCITEPLQDGETYYAATTVRVAECSWLDSKLDFDLVKGGFAYLNREDAELHHMALTTYETIERDVF